MAGGITGTSDWQEDMLKMLTGEELVVYNPRRVGFDSSNKEMEEEQIAWEHLHLIKADAVSFWFPPETLCPITLFELGTVCHRASKPKVFVGCDPDYKRIRDVRIQLSIRNSSIEVVEDLSELANQVKNWVKEMTKI